MGVAAAEHALLLQQLVFDGCIGAFDGEICRRPYHRNCGCALHRSSSDGTCRPRGGSRKDVSFRTSVASAGSISADGGKAKAAAEHVAKQRESSSLMDQCVKLIDKW